MRVGIVAIVILCVLLAGCGAANPLLGKWQDSMTGKTITEFKADGQTTMTVAGMSMGSMPYKVSGNKITVGPGQMLGTTMPEYTQTFTVSGDTLTLGEGRSALTYKRVK